MSEFRKSKIELTAVYKNGDILKQEVATPARVEMLDIPTVDKFKELNIRLAVESDVAEELLEGLVLGDVSLSIEKMIPPVDRA